MTDSKKGEGVFTLLDVDATDEEIEAFCCALGWTPEMGDAEEVASPKQDRIRSSSRSGFDCGTGSGVGSTR